jgi:hypothetical protein
MNIGFARDSVRAGLSVKREGWVDTDKKILSITKMIGKMPVRKNMMLANGELGDIMLDGEDFLAEDWIVIK